MPGNIKSLNKLKNAPDAGLAEFLCVDCAEFYEERGVFKHKWVYLLVINYRGFGNTQMPKPLREQQADLRTTLLTFLHFTLCAVPGTLQPF